MGRVIYFSDKEMQALRETACEWVDIMEGGDAKSCDLAEERLTEGLGSALKKLYCGLNGARIYKDY